MLGFTRTLEGRMRDYNQQIAAEISTVLQILEQHDYPYLEELEVREYARWFDSLLGYRVEGVGEYRRRSYLQYSIGSYIPRLQEKANSTTEREVAALLSHIISYC